MKLYALVAIIIAMLLLDASPSDALRGTRKQCRKTCGPKITQDCREFRRAGKRACKRSILRACRNVSMDACLLASETPPTTTTTTVTPTSGVPSTTQLVPTSTTFVPHTFPTTTTHTNSTTTHTTTSKPPTTSSTTAPFAYGGDWTFFGDLISDDCPGADPLFFYPEVQVTHTPGSDFIGVAIEGYPSLFGTADRFGYDTVTDFEDGACTITLAFSTEVSGTPNHLNAALAIDYDCPTGSCTLAYSGDLEH
jgi:hypothetical protein